METRNASVSVMNNVWFKWKKGLIITDEIEKYSCFLILAISIQWLGATEILANNQLTTGE